MADRSTQINLRLTPDEAEEIRAAAAEVGETLTEYMVSAAIGRARGRLDVRQALAVIRAELEG